MADIVHTVQMHAAPGEVFRALLDSLSGFRFGDDSITVKMRASTLDFGARVAWHCVEGPPDWVGTSVTFDLSPDGDETVVRFGHRNWRETTDLMGRCSAMWARFLFGLKSLLETAEPDDLYA